ncbi:MAG: phytanoyl-CoA dioxygenase family protein [Chitinophagaceae bacterium]
MPVTISTLPSLDSFIDIPQQQIEEFRRNGHTLIPHVLSAEEVEAFRPVILEAAENKNTERRKLEERDTYGKAFLQIMNLWQSNENVKQFTLAKRFGKIAADLLGVDNVRIYHDQALFKEPGGGPTPWHQDQYYWPVDTYNTVTMWMPLVDINDGMGMLTFATGSHKKGNVFDFEISDESEQQFDKYVKEKALKISRPSHMKAGDATFHYGFTIHNAPGNESTKMREVMTIIYIADGARITAPKNEYQEADHRTWIKSLPIGSLVASALNPPVL